MGQVADVIKGLEAKLTTALNDASTANANFAAQQQINASLQQQITTLQAQTVLDDADKAAVLEAQGILNPPVTPPTA